MAIGHIKVPGINNAPTFTQVVKHGNVAYISGQTASDENGNVVGLGDIAKQAEQVMQNMEKALKSVGADFTKVMKVTIFVTDARFRQPVSEVRSKYFPTNPPASTFLVVAGLAQPELLVEIEAIAALD